MKNFYKIPSNRTNRMLFVSISKSLPDDFNQLPSDALLLLLSRSGGGRKRFGYGAVLMPLTLDFDDEKHPAAQPADDDDVDDAADDAAAERVAFSLSDLVDGPPLPLLLLPPDVGGGSSTISSDFSSKMLLMVMSG